MLKIITAIAFFLCSLLSAQNVNLPVSVSGIKVEKWTGVDTKPLCVQVDKAIELFVTFKPETSFSPK